MKKVYEKADCRIIVYTEEDVLTASPGGNDNELPIIPVEELLK